MMAVKAFIPILANSHFNLNFQISCVRTISKPLNLATKQLVKEKRRPSTEQDMPKPTSDYYIRDMTQEDIPKIMEIRKKLKIHDCYSCLQTWNKIHPQGIFLAENKRGQIVATAAFVHNSDEVCIGGLVYVDPEYRNIGLGRKVLELGVGEVSQGRILCGNAVKNMTQVYCDIVMGAPRTDYTLFKNETSCYVNYNSLSEDLPPGVALRPYQDDHLDLVSAYDYNLMGYDRRHLLELSSREENSQTFVALNGRECVGFGSVKLSCMGAARIGPLYADDATIAEALLKNLLKSFPRGRGIMMVTLSNNSKANNLMTKLSVPTTQELVQVFSERILEVDTHKVYAHFDVNFCVF